MLLQLVYVSTVAEPLDEAAMAALCEQSRINNARDEITGVLLSKGDHFLQALEGPKEYVEDAFLRIIADRRHTNVTLLSRRLTTRRDFGDWEMAYHDGLDAHPDIIARIDHLTRDAPDPIRRAFEDLLAG